MPCCTLNRSLAALALLLLALLAWAAALAASCDDSVLDCIAEEFALLVALLLVACALVALLCLRAARRLTKRRVSAPARADVIDYL